MARPLIGLTGRRKPASDVAGFPASLGSLSIDLYLPAYAEAIARAGGLPVHLCFEAEPSHILGRLDGLVLTGGADIDPSRYGAKPEWRPYGSEAVRDEHEFCLLELALADDVPVLGICRGLQVLNVSCGGTLDQDVPAHARYDVGPDVESHDVELARGSILHALYGPRHRVNTLHHQTVHDVGRGLEVTARADDGTVEGLEMTGRPVLAVQWHPEMMQDALSDPVFTWLIRHASA